jgi:hypothetical protein
VRRPWPHLTSVPHQTLGDGQEEFVRCACQVLPLFVHAARLMACSALTGLARAAVMLPYSMLRAPQGCASRHRLWYYPHARATHMALGKSHAAPRGTLGRPFWQYLATAVLIARAETDTASCVPHHAQLGRRCDGPAASAPSPMSMAPELLPLQGCGDDALPWWSKTPSDTRYQNIPSQTTARHWPQLQPRLGGNSST